jgi:hypothetical protein
MCSLRPTGRMLSRTLGTNKRLYYGSGASDLDQSWHGPMTEGFVYDRILSADEIARVQSYAGLRNGVTLEGYDEESLFDYKNAASTVIWPSASNSTFAPFHERVTGVISDAPSDLYQQISESIHPDALTSGDHVIMAAGSTTDFTSANETAGRTGLPVGTSVLFGDDNAAVASWGTTPNDVIPGYQRIGRTWRVRQNGAAGAVSLKFENNVVPNLPDTNSKVYLVIDRDNDAGSTAPMFTDETQVIEGTSDGAGGFVFAGVEFPAGDSAFTLMTTNPINLVTTKTADRATHSGTGTATYTVAVMNLGPKRCHRRHDGRHAAGWGHLDLCGHERGCLPPPFPARAPSPQRPARWRSPPVSARISPRIPR